MKLFDNPDDTFENHRMVMEELFPQPDPETLCENDDNIGEWFIEREFEPTDKLLCGFCFKGYSLKEGENANRVAPY